MIIAALNITAQEVQFKTQIVDIFLQFCVHNFRLKKQNCSCFVSCMYFQLILFLFSSTA